MPVQKVAQNATTHTKTKTATHKEAEVGNIPMTGGHKAKTHANTEAKTCVAEQNFKKDLKSGKLVQNEISVNLFGKTMTKKFDSYKYTPKKGETYGDIKNHYKLAEGALRDAALGDGYSGNLDSCKPTGPVDIDGEAIRMAIDACKENK